MKVSKFKHSCSNAALAIVATAISSALATKASASVLSYTGGTYTQDFNSLPNPGATSVNTANPVTISGTSYSLQSTTFDFANPIDTTGVGTNSSSGGLGLNSTMPGWYGGAAVATKFGATFGDQTTGGDLSFGPASSTNRALGLIATSTTGATYFGVDIVNNTGAPISTISLTFTGEQWKQGTTQKTLSVGYTVDNANALNVVTAATSASYTQLAAITNASTGAVAAVDGTNAANQTPENFTNLALSTPVGVGDSLWITGQISNAGGGGQGYGIDNLSFSAGATSVPEPTSLALIVISGAGLLGRRRRTA